MKVIKFLLLALAIFASSSISAIAQNVGGVLLTVNSVGDTHDAQSGDGVCADAGGQCTLRAAVDETNSNATQDAIIFDLPHPSVIDLTLGELFLVQNLDIVGPGARNLTIRRSTAAGTLNFRVFHTAPTQIFVNIRSLTIANGNDLFGGGLFIENGGVVGLFDAAVTGNSGQVGGGIMSSGKLTVVRCLINQNTTATTGGAIANVGSNHEVAVANSTITGNTATISAGAIYSEGTLMLVNDTISGNASTQGVSSIQSNGTARVLNTIIGRDTGQTINTLQGNFFSAGNNIVTNSTGSTGFAHGVNGDQVSENNAINPMLGPLANNGGQTDTMALLAGSPAIKGGNACARFAQCPLLSGIPFPNGRMDQRRFRRSPIAAQIDVGAFDTDSFNGIGFGGLTLSGLGTGGQVSRYAGAHAFIVNPATLERRHTLVRLNGDITFTNLASPDAYVIEIKSKRRGMLTPIVIAFD